MIEPTQADRQFAAEWNYECWRCSEYEGNFEADFANAVAAHRLASAPAADLVEALVDVSVSLAAAVSLLGKGGKSAKKAAPSDRMFDQMVKDYSASLDRARAALSRYAKERTDG